jgi:hypothetical protein
MSVNYTLHDIEVALMEHPFGLTMDELYEFQQYYTDFWESNVYSEDLQPLDEFVEEFLLWLSELRYEYWKEQLLKIYMDGEITPMIKHQIKLIENDEWGNWVEMKIFVIDQTELR